MEISADFFQSAFGTAWFSCSADIPAVKDQPVVGSGEVFLGNVSGKLFFSFERGSCVAGQSDSSRHPVHVGIYSQCRFSKSHRNNHIGSFSSDTGQLLKFLGIRGNIALIIGNQPTGNFDQVFGFAVGIGTAFDHFQNIRGIGIGQTFQIGKALEEDRGYHIDPFVGALSRQNHCHQQFVRVCMLKFCGGIGLGMEKIFEEPLVSLFLGHGRQDEIKWFTSPATADVSSGENPD